MGSSMGWTWRAVARMLAPVNDLGRTLLVLGFVVAGVGAAIILLPKMPWLGRLPGDVHIEREHFSLHVPLGTCLVASLVATLILNLFFRR
jgi:hypothetical protein